MVAGRLESGTSMSEVPKVAVPEVKSMEMPLPKCQWLSCCALAIVDISRNPSRVEVFMIKRMSTSVR